MNKQRLLDVARACRETPHPDRFSMDSFVSACGTPACALGNYALRSDLQGRFRLDLEHKALLFDGEQVNYFHEEVLDYFDIDDDEVEDLFGALGCGGFYDDDADEDVFVTDPIEAAEFIEDFVRRHEVQP